MSKRGKRGPRRRGGRRKKKGRADLAPGWHLKLSVLRRSAKKGDGEIVVKRMRGWELHLAYRPAATPKEPWSLTALPVGAEPDWAWLSKAADYLKIPATDPANGSSQRPRADDGLSMVCWTWADEEIPDARAILEGGAHVPSPERNAAGSPDTGG